MSANAPRRTILVTGFGGFPGSPRNPTEAMVGAFRRHQRRFARLGVELHCAILPVVYAQIGASLDRLVEMYRPDVILHFGVAGRRRALSVETRAINRAGPLRGDATGRRPPQVLASSGAPVLRATLPWSRVLARLRATGVPAAASRDAGDYVCNATLYHALRRPLAPEVGFIHVPMPRRSTRRLAPGGPRGVSEADLARAALAAVFVLVRPPPMTGDAASTAGRA